MEKNASAFLSRRGGETHGNAELAYYNAAGIGACETKVQGPSSDIVALPVGIMGSHPGPTPLCGKNVQITYKGKTATGTVVDRCPTCVIHLIKVGIDLVNLYA